MMPEDSLHPSGPGAGAAPSPREQRRRFEMEAYSRLLVSDVRLYHEEDVILGRRAGDLAGRLAGPIASARARYRLRFPAEEDQKYFEDEIVRILAGGDPARLG